MSSAVMNVCGALKRIVSVSAMLALALGLGACSGFSLLGESEPAKIYDLSPKSTFDEDLPATPSQLVIQEPVAAAAIDTDRIAVRTSAFEVGYFSAVRWSDRATRMVQARLVESFENSGKITAVGRQAIGLRSDYDLRTELREFQAEYASEDGAPETRVTLNAKLVVQPASVIVASQTFERVEPAASRKFDDVVAAFDEALGGVLKRVVTWALTEMEEDRLDPRSRMERMRDMGFTVRRRNSGFTPSGDDTATDDLEAKTGTNGGDGEPEPSGASDGE